GALSGTITVPSVATGTESIVITGAVSGAQTFANAFTVTALTNWALIGGIIALVVIAALAYVLVIRRRRRGKTTS
ncbi:MAG TPA: hypothetical protein VEG28_05270, partial [Dehalococcoidia bacterium]|nr:hypothetical protein [Dehalococcoidia bacterium]